MYICLSNNWHATNAIKRCSREIEKALLKDVKMEWAARPPAFDRITSFNHDDLTAINCYFRCSKPFDVGGIKIFDKDDQPAKH